MKRGPVAESSMEALTAATQPMVDYLKTSGVITQGWIPEAWDMYGIPEVRFAAREYSNAFSNATIMLARKAADSDPSAPPIPVLEPKTRSEQKAMSLLADFAGGPVGQTELLDRIGTYFVVTGEMVLIGSYDPAHKQDGNKFDKFSEWNVWSTSEVEWTGQHIRIRDSAVADRFQDLPEYIKHVRVWNRHPRWGWESDSPVRGAMDVLREIRLYDERIAATLLSRLTGAGVWAIPQGMRLPSSTGDPAGGSPEDFLRLLMEVASLSIKDRTSAAAMVPILIEAASEDIAVLKDGLISFSSPLDEKILEMRESAIRRWATGVDLPAETVLGMSEATHWNASLISDDQIKAFIIPSLRRVTGNLTIGWLRPALAAFGVPDNELMLWPDVTQLRARVENTKEAQWARDRYLIGDSDLKVALSLADTATPTDEELKRMVLLDMARQQPEFGPEILNELGIKTSLPNLTNRQMILQTLGQTPPGQPAAPFGHGTTTAVTPPPAGNGKQGPQAANGKDKMPANGTPGRAATLSTTGK